MKPLSSKEKYIILQKGTEPPFSGNYLNNKESGIYLCRQCGASLYQSKDKFDSGCGWPSFDDTISNSIEYLPDADGLRTEIVCKNCKGHLGHVFEGEGFTPKNIRHCVNSLSLSFMPVAAEESKPKDTPQYTNTTNYEDAFFAGGCFWGIEDAFQKIPGVIETTAGYMGGTTSNPTYEEVSTGATGHAETVHVQFDPSKVGYEELVKLFFEIHDPTQYNRQGPDIGTQYRSVIFYTNEQQKNIAEKCMDILTQNNYCIVTQLVAISTFFPAENYHQKFTARTGRGECHLRVNRF